MREKRLRATQLHETTERNSGCRRRRFAACISRKIGFRARRHQVYGHPTYPFSEYVMSVSVVAIDRGLSAGPAGMDRAGFLSRDWDFSCSVVSAPSLLRADMDPARRPRTAPARHRTSTRVSYPRWRQRAMVPFQAWYSTCARTDGFRGLQPANRQWTNPDTRHQTPADRTFTTSLSGCPAQTVEVRCMGRARGPICGLTFRTHAT